MALVVGGTDYVQMPNGTTAQRPTTPAAGMTRFNSTTGLLEYYNGTAWVNPSGYPISYLVVAGGGGSGYLYSGGGGAGGLLASTASLLTTNVYTISIGAGGAAGATSGTA